MPVDLESPYKRLLRDIVAISQRIRDSALEYPNSRNFNVFERLRYQLENIRISADAILQAFTKASLTSSTLDERVIDWITNGELHSCLGRLKEMEFFFKPTDCVRPPTQAFKLSEDKLTAVMNFFDHHKGIFHFLLTSDVWDRERSHHQSHELPFPMLEVEHGRDQNQVLTTRTAMTDGETDYYTPPECDSASDSEDSPHVPQRTKENTKRLQKLDEVSRWLAPFDCTQKHNETRKLLQDGTCKWFSETDAYRSWRSGGTQLLWLHGKAGCGKSTLIASTIEHLKRSLQHDEVVVYFYCDFRSERSTSPTELTRSLLSQLLHHIGERGIDPGDLPNKILEQKSQGTLSLDDLNKLCGLVSRASRCFRFDPIIVIDALDECADIGALLHALVELNQSDVRLLVTSRPQQIITNQLSRFQSFSFENAAEAVARDIALHVRKEIDSHSWLRSADIDVKEEILTRLNEKAEGRFRWVQCQLDALKRCESRWELRDVLKNLPNELETTYERILVTIDERRPEGKLARLALVWLVVTMEPLCLAQIVDGFLVYNQLPFDRKTLEAGLLDALSSLVSYREETGVLSLSHFSVKEYLTRGSALPTYRIISEEAHAEIASMCMRCISAVLKQDRTLGNFKPLQSFPMLSYVFSSGFSHIAHVNPGSVDVLDALQSLACDIRNHPTHWELLCELREEQFPLSYPPWPSSRHDTVFFVLIAYSSRKLFQSFLSSGSAPRVGTNPLVYAADLRKTKHAMALLAHGADVNVHGIVIDDSRHASPLDIAIDLGEDMLVGELLQRGCAVSSEVFSTAICMPWCSSRVLVKLMQTDEFTEWAFNIGDERLCRGVFNSARPDSGDSRKADGDRVVLARRLRQIGQNISVDNPLGEELVERAVSAAHISTLEYLLPRDRPPPSRFLLLACTGDTSDTVPVVRFLLHRGVDVHVVSERSKETALHLVAMCPWEPRALELTSILFDAGCSPHALNKSHETPLDIVMRQGYLTVVEFLVLARNVSLPPDVLHFAVDRPRNLGMVKLLIRQGADVNAIFGPTAQTVLHHAILGPKDREEEEESDRSALVKTLIEAGCDFTSPNPGGTTALKLAIEVKRPSIVNVLLLCNSPLPTDILQFALRQGCSLQMVNTLIQSGADVHFVMPNGYTLLHYALQVSLGIYPYNDFERLNLVAMFIEAGCNPNASNFDGKTVLYFAIKCGNIGVIEHLISCGVPLPLDILHSAVCLGQDLRMFNILLLGGADVHTISDGGTILHHVITASFCNWLYEEPELVDLVTVFIVAGCDPNVPNSGGETVLELAIRFAYPSVVERLLLCNVPLPPNILQLSLRRTANRMTEMLARKGVNVNLTLGSTSLEKTFIELAAERGHTLVVEFLFSRDVPHPSNILYLALRQHFDPKLIRMLLRNIGADLNCDMTDGNTALHLAIVDYLEDACWELVEVFLEGGNDPNARNFTGETILQVAAERGYDSVISLLRGGFTFSPNILIALQRRQPLKQILYLIQNGADSIHSTTPSGDTVFHLAVAEYHLEGVCWDLVKSFLDAGCNPARCNSEGKSVLEATIERGYISVVELLLSSGISLPTNILPVVLRKRPVYWMVDFLIREGADVRSVTPNGDSVFHLVIAEYAEGICLHLVEKFVDAGCDPAGCNFKGKTVLQAAVERGYTTVVELLLFYNVPFPPNSDLLLTALQHRCTVKMIELLVRKGVCHYTAANPSSDSSWADLLQFVRASYSGYECHQISSILGTVYKAYRMHASLVDEELPVHATKRPRLE